MTPEPQRDRYPATSPKTMRLHKFIANCGYTSRRRAELLIQAGRVHVNGKPLTSLGTRVHVGQDRVTVNGEEVQLPAPLTILFHKPVGIITSTHDTHDRLTVMDLLPKKLHATGVLPVGRLDQDTRGLLLFTNDGDLNHRVTHPRFEIEKEYSAIVRGTLTAGSTKRLEEGVVLDGTRTASARVTHVVAGPQTSSLRITIHEGRKRQVRKMLAAVGHEVVELIRLRIGTLELGELPEGEWREVTQEEIDRLFEPGPGQLPAAKGPPSAPAAKGLRGEN